LDAGARDAWVVGAKRTAFGAFGGALRDCRATQLGAHAGAAALSQARLESAAVDHVIFGNVVQSCRNDAYCARHVGLEAGLPVETPALTVNRLCGSGFQAVVSAAQEIRTGEAEVCLAGGTELMSAAPHVVRGARWGYAFGKAPPLEDLLWTTLTDEYAGCAMGQTAETLAEAYGVSRAACDDYALSSQQRWAAAERENRFAEEIAPLPLPGKLKTKGKDLGSEKALFARDEHPRPETTAEALGRLPTVFKPGGVVTAGNASGISDGAAALVLTSRAWAERRGVEPLARVAGWASVGVEPRLMGLGPVPAMTKALARAGLELSQIDLIEVNEAFAAQYLAVEKVAELPRERTNVDGGAIALGHPLGASGARILTHLVYELRRRRARYGLGAACIGGGQGIAVVLETLL
jgi:acetyl-CoA C-acetyltransferase/acetyl-CoA acyltransferase 2